MNLSADQVKMLRLAKAGKLAKASVDYDTDSGYELVELQLGGMVDQHCALTAKGRQALSEVWQG